MQPRSSIWHPFTPLKDFSAELHVAKASEAVLYLHNGDELIDAISSWWVITHGHCHPHIQQAVSKQMQTLDHVLFAGFTHTPAQKLTELLKEKVPLENPFFYFSDNGSTAVEVALKLAWQYWKNQHTKKTTILAFENAYHGDTFGSMAVSGRSSFTAPFTEMFFNVQHVPVPGNIDDSDYLKNWETICKKNTAAAFIYEPLVQGAAGMVMYPARVLNEMIRIAQHSGILCIADEVMTGFGRTGQFFASDYLQHKPDLVCLSKGLTGGVLPLGLTVISQQVASQFINMPSDKTFYHGHSFTGNPVACAAACANLELYTAETVQHWHRIHNNHVDFIEEIQKLPVVKRAQCTGTIMVIEWNAEISGYHSSMRDSMYAWFIKKGLLLRPLGNVIYVLPPYCITNQQLKTLYSAIEEFAVSGIIR